MRLCGIVITYYPNIKGAYDNIQRYFSFIDHLIIWENTPLKDAGKYHLSFPNEFQDKITYLGTGKNEGIAYPLNQAIKYAYENGYTHILTMDQDSKWDNFEFYRKAIEKEKYDSVALYAPIIVDKTRNESNFNTEKQVITSGCIVDIDSYFQIGSFCEDFFIDCVDTEYSFRVRTHHYKIKIINEARLNQSFGNIKKVPLLGCYHAHYSPFRIYHIVRNNIWMWRMYKNTDILPKNFFLNQIIYWYIIREPLLTLLCGKWKIQSLTSIMKGLWDGIFGYKRQLKVD